MCKAKFVVTLGERDYYYNGRQYFYRKHTKKLKKSKLMPIKTQTLVKKLVKKIT